MPHEPTNPPSPTQTQHEKKASSRYSTHPAQLKELIPPILFKIIINKILLLNYGGGVHFLQNHQRSGLRLVQMEEACEVIPKSADSPANRRNPVVQIVRVGLRVCILGHTAVESRPCGWFLSLIPISPANDLSSSPDGLPTSFSPFVRQP